jgi:hypothetical protein
MEQPFGVGELDVKRLLSEWSWLCAESVQLIARNGFGDLFLRTAAGGILFLDVGNGTLNEVAESELSFEELLQNPSKRELWFADHQLESFVERGLKPNRLQCIGLKIPVVFAESTTAPDNAYVADLYEHVSFLGDLHRQIANTPDGAKVRLRVGQSP